MKYQEQTSGLYVKRGANWTACWARTLSCCILANYYWLYLPLGITF